MRAEALPCLFKARCVHLRHFCLHVGWWRGGGRVLRTLQLLYSMLAFVTFGAMCGRGERAGIAHTTTLVQHVGVHHLCPRMSLEKHSEDCLQCGNTVDGNAVQVTQTTFTQTPLASMIYVNVINKQTNSSMQFCSV